MVIRSVCSLAPTSNVLVTVGDLAGRAKRTIIRQPIKPQSVQQFPAVARPVTSSLSRPITWSSVTRPWTVTILLTSGIVRGGRISMPATASSEYGRHLQQLEVALPSNIYLRGIYPPSGRSLPQQYGHQCQGDAYSIAMFVWYDPARWRIIPSLCHDAISANHSNGIQFLNNVVTTPQWCSHR
jgi:hypothetical protein